MIGFRKIGSDKNADCTQRSGALEKYQVYISKLLFLLKLHLYRNHLWME